MHFQNLDFLCYMCIILIIIVYDFDYSTCTCILYVEGLDLADMSDIAVLTNPELDTSRKAFLIRNTIRDYQETFTVIEKASCVPLFFFYKS